ncbi:superoxide dismutase family protein [Brachyspira aalborgi]|uniref:superoxide dismutase family protein n=1 Tax=Brachyspira aalborgi TaxID=29522 RepID=UPI003BAF1167
MEVKASGLTLKAEQVGFHLHDKNSVRPTKDASGTTVVGGGLGADIADLGSLTVNADGSVNQTVSSTNIKYSDLKGKSLVIYADATGESGTSIYAAAIF